MIKLALVLALSPASVTPSSVEQDMAIRNVSVVDVRAVSSTHALIPNQTILISGNRIQAVGAATTITVPPGVTVIDGSGKFAIPGLWDMHAHILFDGLREPISKLLIANGVTGIRDMGGAQVDSLIDLKHKIDKGSIMSPRIVAAGPIVDGPQPVWPFSIAVGNDSAGRAAVRTLKAKGADFVKVYSRLPRAAYFAIADEAKKQGIRFAGHVPNGLTHKEASDAGQHTIDHVRIYVEASTEEEELSRERAAAEAQGGAEVARVRAAQTPRILATFSAAKVQELAKRFARNGTWFVPTLAVHRGSSFLKDSALVNDARLKYMHPDFRGMWKTQQERTPDAMVAVSRAYFAKDLEVVRLMFDAGAPLLSGSDMLNPHVYPGFGLHDELGLLVEAGLTPLDALKAATIQPARFLEREATAGSIGAGKMADLVLLEGNPLADISNTRRIHAVILNGVHLPMARLQSMLAEVEEAFRENPH